MHKKICVDKFYRFLKFFDRYAVFIFSETSLELHIMNLKLQFRSLRIII